MRLSKYAAVCAAILAGLFFGAAIIGAAQPPMLSQLNIDSCIGTTCSHNIQLGKTTYIDTVILMRALPAYKVDHKLSDGRNRVCWEPMVPQGWIGCVYGQLTEADPVVDTLTVSFDPSASFQLGDAISEFGQPISATCGDPTYPSAVVLFKGNIDVWVALDKNAAGQLSPALPVLWIDYYKGDPPDNPPQWTGFSALDCTPPL
jgi:hypothetical protein